MLGSKPRAIVLSAAGPGAPAWHPSVQARARLARLLQLALQRLPDVVRNGEIVGAFDGRGDDLGRHRHDRRAGFGLRPGETVKLVAKSAGKLKHELVLGTAQELAEHAELMQKFPEMEHDDPNAVSVEPGETGSLLWEFTSKAGAYDFGCLVPGHYEAGMLGKILVR